MKFSPNAILFMQSMIITEPNKLLLLLAAEIPSFSLPKITCSTVHYTAAFSLLLTGHTSDCHMIQVLRLCTPDPYNQSLNILLYYTTSSWDGK